MSSASKRSSVFYGGLLGRYRSWRLNRRLSRLLDDVPEGMRVVFSGNVVVEETIYAPGECVLMTDFEWEPPEAC